MASKENARAAAEVCFSLFVSDDSKEEKKAVLTSFIINNAEKLDDNVQLIPGWGEILHQLVDSKAVDNIQAKLAEMLAETIVQSLKGLGYE